MLSERLKNSIKDYPDFPKKDIIFKDISPILTDPELFSDLIDKISEYSFFKDTDAVIAIDARGFIFGSAIAKNVNKPLILARKKNKLPAEVHSIDFELEYGTATIEVHKDSIQKDDRVLIIDDLIATGGTAEAAAKLIEISGGKVACFVFVINLFDLNGCDNLVKKGYKVENLIEFPGH